MKTQAIDPRTTRRTVARLKYLRDSALYSTYNVVVMGRESVLLERKPEFCVRRPPVSGVTQ